MVVVPHEPRDVVHESIAEVRSANSAAVVAKVHDLLDRADSILGHQTPRHMLTLLKRAAGVLAYHMDGGQMLTIQALRDQVAPARRPQPELGKVPTIGLGNDTVRDLLSPQVADVVNLATRLGWTRGDFHTPMALTVFGTFAAAGKDSHALAVANRVVPLIGIGTGSSDCFVINQLLELVHGTHHDSTSEQYDAKAVERIVALWRYDRREQMPLLQFDKAFAALIAEEARQRAAFARVASFEELEPTFPGDVVVQRLPHAPYDRRLGLPAGEIMGRAHPIMSEILDAYGYRAVVAYHEEMGRTTTTLKQQLRTRHGPRPPAGQAYAE